MKLERILSKLHISVATELLRRLEEGEATTPDIVAALKLLKDNSVVIDTSDKGQNEVINNILDFLPVRDENGTINRNVS